MALLPLLKGAETISALRDRGTATTMAATAIMHLLSPLTFCWLRAGGDGQHFRLLAESGPDGLHSRDDTASTALTALLERHPEARAAIEQREPAGMPLANGHIKVVMPFFIGSRLDSLLVAECSRLPSLEQQDGIFCFLHFYANYLALLDYGELDSLTGLFNRKTFDETFEQLLSPGRADDLPGGRRRPCSDTFWLAVLDIDHFKHINDTWGHLFGDETLLRFSRLLKQCFRGEDRLFRFGGEEFIVILHADNAGAALHALERFRASLEAVEFPQIGQVTCSIGFARVDPALPPTDILGNADQALYYAKGNGRNRTCHYETLIAQNLIEPHHTLEGNAALDFDIDALFV